MNLPLFIADARQAFNLLPALGSLNCCLPSRYLHVSASSPLVPCAVAKSYCNNIENSIKGSFYLKIAHASKWLIFPITKAFLGGLFQVLNWHFDVYSQIFAVFNYKLTSQPYSQSIHFRKYFEIINQYIVCLNSTKGQIYSWAEQEAPNGFIRWKSITPLYLFIFSWYFHYLPPSAPLFLLRSR